MFNIIRFLKEKIFKCYKIHPETISSDEISNNINNTNTTDEIENQSNILLKWNGNSTYKYHWWPVFC